jgi:hypothetical protein
MPRIASDRFLRTVRQRFAAIPIALIAMLAIPLFGADQTAAQTPPSVFHFAWIDESIAGGVTTLRVHIAGPTNSTGVPLTLTRYAPSGVTSIPVGNSNTTYTEPTLESRICYRVVAASVPVSRSDVLCYIALPTKVATANWALQPIGTAFTNVTPFQLNNTNPTETSVIRFRGRFDGATLTSAIAFPEFACSSLQCTWDRNPAPALTPSASPSCYIGYNATLSATTDALCIYHSGDGFPFP